jgi:CspA family cold shock protein
MAHFGVVQWFSRAKGYGFIREDGGSDIFVHHSQILGEGFRALETGQRVRYEIGDGPGGAQAIEVEPLDSPYGSGPVYPAAP